MPVTTPITQTGSVTPITPVQSGAPAVVNPSTVAQSALTTPTVSTVQDQLTGILNKGGPLMQQAETYGAQQAQQRGLLNSSMGIQAAQAAVYGAATPIAQADASATNNVNLQNAQTLNNNLQTTANTENSINQFNSQSATQNNQFNTSATNSGQQFNAQQSNAMSQWNAGQQNAATLQAMDVNSRETLANIEADYKQIMQVNSSAGSLYEQAMKNITDIQGNKDIADKTTAVNSQLAWLKSGMQMIQNLNGVTGLVTF